MTISKELLIHWWHYYGKGIYTLAELEEFERVIDRYGTDKVLDVAVNSFICNDGSPTIMLLSIRSNAVDKLFEVLPKYETFSEDTKKVYDEAKAEFVRIISESYHK